MPPDIGVSQNVILSYFAVLLKSFAAMGEIVLVSTIIVPGDAL